MARIAIDMDEVIADALGKQLHLYNEHFGTAYTREDVDGCHLSHLIPEDHRRVIHEFVHTETFFADLAVIEHAQEVLEELSQQHELYITTAAMEVPRSFAAKYEWLREHFPFISPLHYVFCGYKTIVNADFLIDDSVRHFETFTGTGILFAAPHNKLIAHKPKVVNWLEIRDAFRSPDVHKTLEEMHVKRLAAAGTPETQS